MHTPSSCLPSQWCSQSWAMPPNCKQVELLRLTKIKHTKFQFVAIRRVLCSLKAPKPFSTVQFAEGPVFLNQFRKQLSCIISARVTNNTGYATHWLNNKQIINRNHNHQLNLARPTSLEDFHFGYANHVCASKVLLDDDILVGAQCGEAH